MSEEKENKRHVIKKGYNASQSINVREKYEEFGYNQRGSIEARAGQDDSLQMKKQRISTKKVKK